MRNEIEKGFQTAIIFCLESPEIPYFRFSLKRKDSAT